VPGKGLTSFKVYSEFVICGIVAAGLMVLYLRRHLFEPRVYRLISASMVLMIVMELCFTLFVSDAMSDAFNEVGHLLKICVFYLVYKAVVVTGLRDPINLLFRDLKAREESLSEAQRLARLGRWEWHLGSGHWEWTPEVRRFFGLSDAVVPSLEAMLQPLPPQERFAFSQALERSAGGGGPFEMTLFLGSGVGEVKFAQLRGEALADRHGRVNRVAGTLLDVSINQFSIEKSEEAVFWLNGTGGLAYVNNAACRLLGYSRAELLTLSASDLNPDHPAGVFEAHFGEIKRQGSKRYEASLRRHDGSLVPVEICANYLAYAGAEYDIAFVRDMTQHKLAEAKLIHASEIYAALSQTNQAIVHYENRQDLFDAVVTVAVRFGHFRAAWIGITDDATLDVPVVAVAGECRDYVDRLRISIAPDTPFANGATGRCIRLGAPQIVNDFAQSAITAPWHQAGAVFGFKAAAAFPIANRGRTIGALSLYSDTAGFFTDDLVGLLTEMSGDISFALDRMDLIAANAQQEAELRASVERLTTSNTELERFAYVASHDLQEPLRNIISFTQLLERRVGATLAEEDLQSCHFVVDSAKRMGQMVNDLLAFSRVNAKDIPFGPVALGGVCAAAVDNLHDAIAESGAEITVGVLPEVAGDTIQLTQLFQNLIGNAIKFRRQDTPPRVVVSAEWTEEGSVVSVTDNGIGIAATDQDIFGIFRRLHPVGRFPGSGVGLAICRRIVQRHNGRIWYDSQPGQGTSFRFMLPAASDTARERQGRAAPG